MKTLKLSWCYLLAVCLFASFPLAASAQYFYRTLYPAYYPSYYYGGPSVVTYPSQTTDRVVVYPTTTTTSSYWWYGGRPDYYRYDYGTRPCFLSGDTTVCW